ncbi:MAG: hypothetical protein LBC73_03495 [Oscillospiraceae bacterium]|nr:hypothetical protein [Oscillospiraceae bacterium]
MKVAVGGQQCIIQPKRKYSTDELFEIMRNGNIEDKFGPIELKKEIIGGKVILVKGLKGFINEVKAIGKNISVVQNKREDLGKATLMNMATFGISGKMKDIENTSHFLGLGGAKDNKEIMKELAEEIEKLVEVK